NLPHFQKMHRVIFVTFSTDKRWILPPTARQTALDCFLSENGVSAEVHAAVVMPDHVHLLLTPLVHSGLPIPLAEIMRLLKGRSARAINLLLNRAGRVWQAESFDHVLRSNVSLAKKVEYICQNPVRAGLVRNETEYPWFWRGILPII
ncbi:MAG TPA: transposase, partial [Terriglobales bacterium]|nr:transposase [Terriglobales bacterium]